MEMDASFVQTPSGKDSWGHDIIFEFKGDDDFWLYVDDELIIDLGGIHSALAGNVNFATGVVNVEDKTTNLRALFASNYQTRHPEATEQEVNAYLSGYFNDKENIFKDYSAHTMKIFYMERGAGASNLHMRFNLSYITAGHVMLTKKVTGSDDMDFNLVEYPYQIWYKDEAERAEHLLRNDDEHISVSYQNSTQVVHYEESYTPPGGTQSYDSVYFLNPGKSAEIHFPANTIEYKIIECGVNTEVYEQVKINDAQVTGESAGNVGRAEFHSGWIKVSDRPTVVFENCVKADALRTLSIQKKLFDHAGHPLYDTEDSTTFSYRLYLSNGSDDTLRLANMYRYYVRDRSGNLCSWDASAQKFVSIGQTELSGLSSEQRESVTFETSMNGAISKIPAWYTVAVPSLPVGTKFKVEERASEIPLGYRLTGYEPEPGTYIIDTDEGLNTGWIRAKESPKMYVCNQRGWELKGTKIWSDEDYTSTHAPIYTAVYAGDRLVEGTVRRMRSPETTVRYYFASLTEGKSISDYRICEVEVVSPVFEGSSDRVTGWQSIHPLDDNDKPLIAAAPKDSSTAVEHSYTVSYERGEATQTAGDVSDAGNVRTDTITNTRSDGVVITLYDMKTKIPLRGGTFILQHGSKTIGTFTSDAHGRITVMYDCKRGENYTLTQTSPPESYIGLPQPVVFNVSADHSVAVSGNEAQWASGRSANVAGASVIAYIDVFNKPFTLQAVKISTRTNAPIGGAHFALYRNVQGLGGQVKDYTPMAGYEDLVCDDSGVIPKIDNTLPPGTYYLTETVPPAGHKGISGDVVFTVSALGSVMMESDGLNGYLTASDAKEENAYLISVPNTLPYTPATLTVTKTVTGSYGNKEQDFTFTLHVEGAPANETYTWSKNNVSQDNPLHSGDTFTLRDNESVTVTLPQYVRITVTEENGDYETTFRLGDNPAEKTASADFILTGNETLQVVNTRNTLLPTGVTTHTVWAVLLLLAGLAGIGLILLRRREEG